MFEWYGLGMALTTTYERDIDVIDVNDLYFIARTDQWSNHPDDQLVLGYYGNFPYVMPVNYFEILGDPDDYYEKDIECGKHNCIRDGVLRVPQGIDLAELGWCSECHRKAKERWRELLKRNSDLAVSQFI